MSSAVQDLEPREIWSHFEALAQIPRGSGNEAGARQFVLDQAARLGLEAEVDGPGNVIVRKPAWPGREDAPVTALQTHLDMVCEKNAGTPHDFERDPIQLVRKDGWVTAGGTTLGADNGIGVAAALGVLASRDIQHGPIEAVFTIDEETGLTGATNFEPGRLRARYFLNLDGEEKGSLCIGCAGGLNTSIRATLKMRKAGGGTAWKIQVAGLRGGHSGIDIHKGRANAIKLLGRVLQTLGAVEIAALEGGSKRNAIPREATALVVMKNDPAGLIEGIERDLRGEVGSFDPELRISAEPAQTPERVLEAGEAERVLSFLAAMPDGVLAMSPDVPGLVQTSTNIGTLLLKDGEVSLETLQRSSVESSKQAAGRVVSSVCRLAGFEAVASGQYPGWKPEPDSELVHQMQQVHERVFGTPARLEAVHAGLECGVIGEKYPGMQMVSFGPQIENPHSPGERVEIESVAAFWKYLRAVLEKI